MPIALRIWPVIGWKKLTRFFEAAVPVFDLGRLRCENVGWVTITAKCPVGDQARSKRTSTYCLVPTCRRQTTQFWYGAVITSEIEWG